MHTGCSERPLETRLSGCLFLGTSPGPPCMLGPPLRSTPCRVCSRGTDCPARPSTGRVSVTAAGGGRRCRAGAAPGVRGVPVLMETSTGARGGEQPGGPHGIAHAELRAQRGSGWAWALCPLPPRQPPLGRSCCSGRGPTRRLSGVGPSAAWHLLGPPPPFVPLFTSGGFGFFFILT